MTYGIPYQGSKSRIAEALIRVLPSGKRFVDLFGGGAAMTHIAALSGKYESVLYNDIQPNLVKLVQDAIAGKYNYDVFTPEFITRERFFAEKETDAYVKYVWSFSNDGELYLFGTEIEEEKEHVHNYIVYGQRDEYIEENFGKIILTQKAIRDRRLEWRRKSRQFYGKRDDIQQLERLEQLERRKARGDVQELEAVERLQELEAVERLQELEAVERLQELEAVELEFTCKDYHEYEYEDGDIVYCDPPYEKTTGYNGTDFDNKAFYEWVISRPYDVYFSSYDGISDKRFSEVWAKTKRNLMGGSKNQTLKIETLYVNHPIDFRFNNYEYVVQKQKEKQMTIFGGET